jgi:hypothetical protein
LFSKETFKARQKEFEAEDISKLFLDLREAVQSRREEVESLQDCLNNYRVRKKKEERVREGREEVEALQDV